MEHHFDIELACEVGVEKAILLHNLVFWIQHNQANETHEHDGRTWTYNSAKAFTKLMPYLNPKSVSRWMRDLEKDGYILSSSGLNTTAYDHTKWYALGPKIENRFRLPEQEQNEQSMDKNEHSTAQNEQSIAQNEHPIPDIKPDIKLITPIIPLKKVATTEGFEKFWQHYPHKVGKGAARKEWSKIKPDEKLVEKMMNAVDVQKDSVEWTKDGGQFIPNPATWLHQGRWDDELKPLYPDDPTDEEIEALYTPERRARIKQETEYREKQEQEREARLEREVEQAPAALVDDLMSELYPPGGSEDQ